MSQSRVIAFTGTVGSSKSTHMKLLCSKLKRKGLKTRVSFLKTGHLFAFILEISLARIVASKRLASKLGYKVLGYISREGVLRLHSQSLALLLPSICEEPLPYMVMEAMAMGTLPIASRVGGIPEIVEGTYAEDMLFEVDNVEELVERVESVLAMSRERSRTWVSASERPCSRDLTLKQLREI